MLYPLIRKLFFSLDAAGKRGQARFSRKFKPRAVQWVTGNDDHNLGELLLASPPSIVRQLKLLLISHRPALHTPLRPATWPCLAPLAHGLGDCAMETAVTER